MAVDVEPRIEELRRRVLYEGNLVALILAMAAPLVVSTSVNVLYEIVDTLWLSRLGSPELSTPTVSWPFRGVVMSVIFGVSSSSSAIVGQYIGARRYREASRAEKPNRGNIPKLAARKSTPNFKAPATTPSR